jgi:hypothetical protein
MRREYYTLELHIIRDTIAVQIGPSYWSIGFILLGFSIGIRPFQNQVHHRGTEDTEESFSYDPIAGGDWIINSVPSGTESPSPKGLWHRI